MPCYWVFFKDKKTQLKTWEFFALVGEMRSISPIKEKKPKLHGTSPTRSYKFYVPPAHGTLPLAHFSKNYARGA